MRYRIKIAAVALWVALAGCVHKPVQQPVPAPQPAPVVPVTARYLPAQWADLPDWPGQQLLAGWPAWLKSCEKLHSRPQWQPVCAQARALTPVNPVSVREFFERHFTPWHIESSSGERSGLITGYYEVQLSGGLGSKPGRVPLYGVPDDMLTLDFANQYPELKGLRLRGRVEGRKVVPYWSRRDIAQGKLNRAKVVAWADDAMDAAILQIQGSGRVRLDDGTTLRLGYADQNGHPYRAIGKWLVEQGELQREQVTMQSIRAWAVANPSRREEMLDSNPSYVFMKPLPPSEGGPIGALNVPLTAGASIAVDSRFIPLGSPIYLATAHPADGSALQRLVNAQDTGGAIRGPVRADLYWGSGYQAGELAGITKQQGRMWLLWPRGLALPAQP